MMLTTGSLVILALGTLAVVISCMRFGGKMQPVSERMHRLICTGVFALGCFFRLFQLGGLPNGISAEEALVGMQAKALWETGGFLFDGGWTTQLAQWAGESTGPLLATLSAPFVGLFGMSAWAVRLPLVLLSCAAMPAAYALGKDLAGRDAGRWMLSIYALCPYFVLSARLTCGANAAVYLLVLALSAMVKGMDRPIFAYAGAVLMALTAYAQNMYFFISPLVIAAAAVIAAAHGMKKKHAFSAAALGLIICIPAMLTLWVNLSGAEGFKWLGVVQIPALEAFDKADSVLDGLKTDEAYWSIVIKTWAVITGGVFQILEHMNISPELFAPTGMGALYVLSIPLILLGGLSLLHGLLQGRKSKCGAGRVLMAASFVITLVMLILYGSIGALDLTGCTDVFDYSSLLLFDALMMTAGLCVVARKSRVGASALSVLFCACVVMLGMHLFGGGYQDNANVYFQGFGEAAKAAERIQEESGAKVNVTGTVYPHITPSDAAEIMYLYATDADPREAVRQRGEGYEVIYAPGMENPDPRQIYLVTQDDIASWDLSPFHYEEIGDYVLLSPANE